MAVGTSRTDGTPGRPLNNLRCPYKGCQFKGGSLYLKVFRRKTRHGVTVHHYWVISHGEENKYGKLRTVMHYIGKKPKGKLAVLAREIEAELG